MLFETRNWKDRFAKGPLDLAVNPLNSKNKSQIGPWLEVGEGAGGAGRTPASWLDGGEGEGVGEQEDIEGYPKVVLDGVGGDWTELATVAIGAAAGVDGGGSAPVREGG